MGVVSINYYCCEHCSLMFLRDFRFLRGLGGDVVHLHFLRWGITLRGEIEGTIMI